MGLEFKRVFHFSGGESSALMTILNYREGDIVIFCDTGREDQKTYKFLNDFEAFENIPVIRLQYNGGWKEMLRKMKGIPNRAKRRCTIEMKIKTARRYLRSIGLNRYIQFIGYRSEEQNRIKDYHHTWKFVQTYFPLDVAGIDKQQVVSYWAGKPYHLEVPEILKNCDLCFQKGEAAVIAIIKDDPSKADKWIADEEDKINNPHGYTYFDKHSVRQLRDAALLIKKEYDLNEIKPAFNCSCRA